MPDPLRTRRAIQTQTKARAPALVWVCALAIVAGCTLTPSAPPPQVDAVIVSAAQARGWDEAALRRGRTLYSTKCARCHSPVLISYLTVPEWDETLPRMIDKAGLEDDAAADVRAYIMAVHDVKTAQAKAH